MAASIQTVKLACAFRNSSDTAKVLKSLPAAISRLSLSYLPASVPSQKSFYEDLLRFHQLSALTLQIDYCDEKFDLKIPNLREDLLVQMQSTWKQLPHLTKLSLKCKNLEQKHCLKTPEGSIGTLIFLSLTQLKECPVEDLCIENLNQPPELQKQLLNNYYPLKQLKKIRIKKTIDLDQLFEHFVCGISTYSFHFILQFLTSQIAHFEVTDQSYTVKQKSIDESMFLQFLNKLPNITRLQLNSYKINFLVQQQSLLQLALQYTSLRSLDLASCQNLNSTVFQEIFLQNHATLQVLNLDFTQIEDQDLEFINSYNIQLVSLSLNKCKRLSKQGLLEFFSQQKSLSYLSLRHLLSVTKAVLNLVAENNHATLNTLFL